MKFKVALIIAVVSLGIFFIFNKPNKKSPEAVNAIIEKHIEKITPAIKEITKPENILKNKETNEYDYTPVTTEDRKLKTSRYLLAKALPTEADKELLHSMYKDTQYMNWVLDLIRKPSPKDFGHAEEVKRMDAVTLFEEALTWKDQPHQAELKNTLVKFITSYEVDSNLAENIKKSYAADYVEMFKLLHAIDTKLANSIAKKESNTQRIRMIKFAKTFFELGEEI